MKYDSGDIERSIDDKLEKIKVIESSYEWEDTDLGLIGTYVSEQEEAKRIATIKLQAAVSIIGLLSIGAVWWFSDK